MNKALDEGYKGVIEVLEYGAKKHGDFNFLKPDGKTCSHRDNIACIFRHVAQASVGVVKDHESGLHPILHAACRCLILYVRNQQVLVHKED